MKSFPSYLIILSSYFLDQLLGDPHFRLHPVRLIGDVAEIFRKITYPLGYLGGLITLFLTSLIFISILLKLASFFPLIEIIALYFFIAEKSLRREAETIGWALKAGDLPLAREKLSFIVGRETKGLDLSECIRAAVETVAENFTDAFVGPLFWYLIGGLPGVVFYKCVETLDSMYGYRTPKWQKFGFFPARVDDLLNFLPARLAAFFLSLAAGLLGFSFKRALRTAWKEAHRHDSPNSGWTEAAVAGALGIELGGPVVYQGKFFEKARFGPALREREVEDVFRATKLLRLASFLFVLFISSLEVVLWNLGYPHLIGLITSVLKGA